MDGADLHPSFADGPTLGAHGSHSHANVRSTVSVTVGGSISGGTDTGLSVQPTIILNYIIAI